MARSLPALLVGIGLLGCGEGQPAPLKDAPTPALIERMQEVDPPETVFDELVRRGPAILPELVAALRVEDELRAQRVSPVLARIGGAAVPPLCELLRTGAPHERARALMALGLMGVVGESPARVAQPDILAALEDESPDVRQAAIRTLGSLGPCDEASASALILALRKDTDSQVRIFAAAALGGWANRPGAEEALAEALGTDPDNFVRQSAANAFARLPTVSAASLDALRAAERSDRDPKVKQLAALTLAIQEQRAGRR